MLQTEVLNGTARATGAGVLEANGAVNQLIARAVNLSNEDLQNVFLAGSLVLAAWKFEALANYFKIGALLVAAFLLAKVFKVIN